MFHFSVSAQISSLGETSSLYFGRTGGGHSPVFVIEHTCLRWTSNQIWNTPMEILKEIYHAWSCHFWLNRHRSHEWMCFAMLYNSHFSDQALKNHSQMCHHVVQKHLRAKKQAIFCHKFCMYFATHLPTNRLCIALVAKRDLLLLLLGNSDYCNKPPCNNQNKRLFCRHNAALSCCCLGHLQTTFIRDAVRTCSCSLAFAEA